MILRIVQNQAVWLIPLSTRIFIHIRVELNCKFSFIHSRLTIERHIFRQISGVYFLGEREI